MQLAKSIMLKSSRVASKALVSFLFLFLMTEVSAQSNSPYSRYGLGDAFPGNSITTRAMGGISAGYSDIISINFNNPASYSSFYGLQETKSKKLQYGRVVFDVGINLSNRTLIEPNTPERFTSSDLFFSYLQIGIPLKKNWGLSFGLRPLTKIGYKINESGRLKDPVSGEDIDSAITQFSGTGGSYMPSIGTGYGFRNFSVGVNMSYLFGNKDINTSRALINDSVSYYSSQHQNNYSFGSLFFNAGLQYKIDLKSGRFLKLGLAGNWKQTLHGSQDVLRQTVTQSTSGEAIQIDSVYQQKNIKGEITYPSNYTAGFVYQNYKSDGRGFLLGLDFTQSKWSEYVFFGQKDSVQNGWNLQAGGQITPRPGSSYFSRIGYRFGFLTGRDYIKVKDDLPFWGATFGMALPIRTSRLAPNQYNAVNVSFEFLKRGNENNLLKENSFRLSVGFNLTDLWFVKRKYE